MSILITGGIKSGKSSYALKLCEKYQKKLFIATGEGFDESMKKRIAMHQKERKSMNFNLIEEPIFISKAINENAKKYDIMLLDCLTLWVNNLIYYEKNTDKMFDDLISVLQKRKNIILVTNEVGLGIAPDNELSLKYIDLLGILNRNIAQVVDEVILMSCGIPLKLK